MDLDKTQNVRAMAMAEADGGLQREDSSKIEEIQSAKESMEQAYVQQLMDMKLSLAESQELLEAQANELADAQRAKQEVEQALMEQLNFAAEQMELLTTAAEEKVGRMEGLLQETEEAGLAKVEELQRTVAEREALLEDKDRQLQDLETCLAELQPSESASPGKENGERLAAAQAREQQLAALLKEKDEQALIFTDAMAALEEEVMRLRGAEEALRGAEDASAEKEEHLANMAQINQELTERLQQTEEIAEEYATRLQQAEAMLNDDMARRGTEQVSPVEEEVMRQQAQDAEGRIAQLQELNGEQDRQLLKLQEALAASKKELLQQAAAAEAKTAQLEAMAMSLESEVEQQRVAAEVSTQELEVLRKEHGSVKERAQELEAVSQSTPLRMQALVEESQALLEENATLRQRLVAAQEDSSRLQALLEELQAALDENGRLKEALAAAESECGRARDEAAVARRGLEEATEKMRLQAAEGEASRAQPLVEENGLLREQLRAAEAGAQRAMSLLAEKDRDLEQQGQGLRELMSRAEAEQERTRAAEAKAALAVSTLEERERLIQQLQEGKGSEERERVIAQLKRDLGGMSQEMERLRASQAEATEAAEQHMRAQAGAAEASARRLEEQLRDRESRMLQMEQELVRVKEELNKSAQVDRLDASSRGVLMMEQELAQIRAAGNVEKTGKWLLQARGGERGFSVEEEKSALTQQLQAQFQREYDAVRAEVAQTRQGLEAAVTERDSFKCQLESAVARESQRMRALEEEKRAMRQHLQEQLEGGQAQLQRRAAEAQQELLRVTQERDGLRQALSQRSNPASPSNERVEAQLARVEQERAVLQEQLTQQTVAYSRELENVGAKMQLLEEALVATGGIPEGGHAKPAASDSAVQETVKLGSGLWVSGMQPSGMQPRALPLNQAGPPSEALSCSFTSGTYRRPCQAYGSPLQSPKALQAPLQPAAPFQNLAMQTGAGVSPLRMQEMLSVSARHMQCASPPRQRPAEQPFAMMAGAQPRAASPLRVTTTVHAASPTASASIPVNRASMAGPPSPIANVNRSLVAPGLRAEALKQLSGSHALDSLASPLSSFEGTSLRSPVSPLHQSRAPAAAGQMMSFDILSSQHAAKALG